MSSSFFRDAHHFVSNIDTLIATQSYHVHTERESDLGHAFQQLSENISEGAMHNSDERCDPPMCHPETRKAVQEDLFSWITHGQEEPQPKKILWMSGPAGCGKTAIASTVAEECEARGLLAGSFFCSSFSGSHKRRSKRFVITTLAYQLMQNDSTGVVRKSILSSIQSDPTIFRKRLKDQCRVLLLQPFQKFHNRGSLRSTQQIIVIDGLDEIESSDSRQLDRQEALRKNEADQVEILFSLLHATHHPAFPFRILIFSRPERGIREFFASQQAKDPTLELFLNDKYNPDDDIELFLRSKFSDIRRRYHLPPSWPSEDTIKALVYKASGQFVYASTIIRFLQDGSNPPPHQLDRVLRLRPTEGTTSNPFAALDALYTHILNSTPDPTLAIEWILSLTDSMAYLGEVPALYSRQLLERRPGEAGHLLGPLPSLIDAPTSDDEPYRVYHKSLVDFLLDFQRGQRIFPRVGDAQQLVRRSYLVVLKNKRPSVPLTRLELDNFLSHFVENIDGWINVVLVGGPDRFVVRRVLAGCDATWWADIIVRVEPGRAHNHISDLFKHVHGDCESHALGDDGCTLVCSNWREGILSFCRANGWTVPSQQHYEDEKRWNKEEHDEGAYSFECCFRPPEPPATQLLSGGADAEA